MESFNDNDIVNDFIKDEEDVSYPSYGSKKHKNEKNNNKISLDKSEENPNQKVIKIRLISMENNHLIEQINSTNNLIKYYKNRCKEQNKKINELKKKINEMNNKKEEKKEDIKEENEKIFFYNDSFEEQMNFAMEEQIADKNKKKSKNIYNNNIVNTNDKLDRIKTIIFDIDNTYYYQCGICMDSFNDQESVKKLKCGHIYHRGCLEQWIQTNNYCQLCMKII